MVAEIVYAFTHCFLQQNLKYVYLMYTLYTIWALQKLIRFGIVK